VVGEAPLSSLPPTSYHLSPRFSTGRILLVTNENKERRRAREAAHLAILLAGAAILLGLSIGALPWRSGVLRAPSTPFDNSLASAMASDFRLFAEADAVLPPGVSVTAISEPRDSGRETALHRAAIALLPRRKIYPAALWSLASPNLEAQADYIVVAGRKPSQAPGDLLLLEMPSGTIWKRRRG